MPQGTWRARAHPGRPHEKHRDCAGRARRPTVAAAAQDDSSASTQTLALAARAEPGGASAISSDEADGHRTTPSMPPRRPASTDRRRAQDIIVFGTPRLWAGYGIDGQEPRRRAFPRPDLPREALESRWSCSTRARRRGHRHRQVAMEGPHRARTSTGSEIAATNEPRAESRTTALVT